MTLTLSGKNNEIASLIPRAYRASIFNSIIAKSLNDGTLLKELSLYLSSEEMDEFINDSPTAIDFKITRDPIKIKQESNYKPKIKKFKEEDHIFAGFD